MIRRLIRKTVWNWQDWRARRKLQRAIPILRELDERLAEYRRQHKRGSARLVKAKKAALHQAMGGLPAIPASLMDGGPLL